jgi:hypothetical protein
MSDLSLYYSGGSGGFICLHSLLLTDQYYCSLAGMPFISDLFFSENFDYITKHQWNIQNINDWKSTEFWPDNEKTSVSTVDRLKIFFHCNAFTEPKLGKSLLIYTDIHSQHSLSKLKKANWYSAPCNYEGVWQSTYHDIKAPSWDQTVGLSTELSTLPQYQQDEIYAILGQRVTIDAVVPVIESEAKILANYATLDNGIKVTAEVAEFYNVADYSVILQDVINTNGKALTDVVAVSCTHLRAHETG